LCFSTYGVQSFSFGLTTKLSMESKALALALYVQS
jgi:hypothetical protein